MKKISVIGSGTMGNGIAHIFAQNNFQVSLIDISEEALVNALKKISNNLNRLVKKEVISEETKQKTISNIKTFTSIKEGVINSDLAIEAASERLDLKIKIFQDLDLLCPKETILATNTSSISITKIAKATKRQDKVIGMHFMNPVPIMKLVEVIKGEKTSKKTTEEIMKLSEKLNKIPVEVNDAPGFVANRILMPMINEAILTLQQNVSGVIEIDTVMKLGMSHPMGPLHLADFIGLDVCLSILEVMHEDFNEKKYEPCALLKEMVKNKELGVKSNIGFYDYSEGLKMKKLSKRFI